MFLLRVSSLLTVGCCKRERERKRSELQLLNFEVQPVVYQSVSKIVRKFIIKAAIF